MKKLLLTTGIAILIGVIIFKVTKSKKKKPCGCGKTMPIDVAIENMTEQDLKDQISKYTSIDLSGKSVIELRAILKNISANQ